VAVDGLAGPVAHLAAEATLRPRALAERLLVGEPVRAELPPELKEQVERAREKLILAGVDPMAADVEAHYRWIEDVSAAVTSPVVDLRVKGRPRSGGVSPLPSKEMQGRDAPATGQTLTDTVDRFLLHKVWGLLAFLVVMGGLFVSVFFLADPLMGATEGGIEWLGTFVEPFVPAGPLRDLWTDGIVAGVGGVLVFVPQIAVLFLLLAILEDSGYLARAAFLMDRLLSRVGLHGKSFIPMLSGFACAIPGIMAARTIESRRERMATIFVLPFTSCSARLPVYALLIGAFFASYSAWAQAGILLGLYVLGIVAAFATAWAMTRGKREPAPSSFILELPSYKVPQPLAVARVVGTNTWAFVSRAGTIIFALSVVLWAMAYYPRSEVVKDDPTVPMPAAYVELQRAASIRFQEALDAEGRTLSEDEHRETMFKLREEVDAGWQLRNSIAGRVGRAIEPVIAPLGFDWKMGVGLVGAFAAREVFVSTMGIVYSAGDAEADDAPLRAAMAADVRPDGTPVWTPLVAANLLVWFVLAMQCVSTLAIVRRETGGWRWPLVQLAYMNALAWVVCLVVYQVGRQFVAG